ncbi:MAG: DNA polymerase III subunit alpha [Gammaproteobacteria bacterium]|nr:MAG: DNA polymerase III subunit alpha [Gammaproteobacteria bacterium]
MNKFCHLSLHSEYSINDGLVSMDDLAQKTSELGYESVAITDNSNLFGFVNFYQTMRENGIKPICGSEMTLEGENTKGQLTLLARNLEGYRNLMKLISFANTNGKRKKECLISLEILKDNKDGLIMFSGGLESQIAHSVLADKFDLAEKQARFFKDIFQENFFLEITRVGFDNEKKCNDSLIEISKSSDIPLIASNRVRFLNQNEFESHETRVSIQSGYVLSDPRRKRDYKEDQYLKSFEEMQELFEDIPEAIDNAFEVSKMCNLEIKTGIYVLPDFETPDELKESEYLRKLSEKGILEKTKFNYLEELPSEYLERFNYELDTILKMGYEGYFLIVADFVNWAKSNDVPVGPGRGSGAGSLIAYALGITGLDPMKYDLLFERFLNPDRISNPDFDIDFCRDGREKVIDYVTNKYGKHAVAQICTFGTMAARAVVRDVARAQGKSYSLGDKIAKLIPFSPEMTLERAINESKDLKQILKIDEDASEIFEMALKLEGTTRSVGKHAAGVVIAPSAINDYSPLYLDADTYDENISQSYATQYSMEDIEAVGLQKFDFLGLKTLTVINNALLQINDFRDSINLEPINIDELDLDDKGVFELLQKGITTAVFQMESRGMREYLIKLKPNTFEDIIAMIALYRPGPLEMKMVDTYIDRKNGDENIDYSKDNEVEKILKSTYGVIVYQEQVMQLAQEFSGFTLGQADILRKAMGKKIPEVMESQKESFIEGAQNKNKVKRVAEDLWDQIETFAGYGFNKSHSAAYALISYQTAWLKSHYPSQFMASALSSELDDTDKIKILIDDSHSLGLKINPPDINKSSKNFLSLNEENILFGLGAIKGVGDSAIENIVEERSNGDFKSLKDFCFRVDLSKVDKRCLEPLIKSGAMDIFSNDRFKLLDQMEDILKLARQELENLENGQTDMFGVQEFSPEGKKEVDEANHSNETSKLEFESLGYHLQHHPVDENFWELEHISPVKIKDLVLGKNFQRCCGVIITHNRIQTRRGVIVFATLDDNSDRIELTINQEVLDQSNLSFNGHEIIIADGEVIEENIEKIKQFGLAKKMRVTQLYTLEQARIKFARKLSINVSENQPQKIEKLIENLQNFSLEETSDGCPVELNYHTKDGRVGMDLRENFNISLTNDNFDTLKRTCGIKNIDLHYFLRN